MCFPWYVPYVNKKVHNLNKKKFINMHIDELKQRATLLFNLNFQKEKTKKILKMNVKWDFELQKLPTFFKDIDKIVDEIYTKK